MNIRIIFRLLAYSYFSPLRHFFIKNNSLFDVCKLFLKKGDIAFDIGANNGGSTLLISSFVGHAGMVLAFEPNKEIASQLLEYEKFNFLKNIEVKLVALGSKCQIFPFYIDTRSGSQASTLDTLHVKIESNQNHASFKESKVEVVTLDSFINKRANFIKMDVEVFELDVILGGIEYIKKYCPIIYFESFFDDRIEAMLRKKIRIAEIFTNLGYQIDLIECFSNKNFSRRSNLNLATTSFQNHTGLELLAIPPQYQQNKRKIFSIHF